jgi:hypothetical protein
MRVAIIAVVLAVATTAWTWWPKAETEAGESAEQGQLLTRAGKEVSADKVAALRVVIWDDKLKAAQGIKVEKKAGEWIIPSHFDYPADAEKRVGDTAGAVLNVPQGQLITSNVTEHAEYGVIDPLDPGSDSSQASIGRRVTLWDTTGAELVDVIIGKQVPNAQVHYVRRATESAVYTAEVQPRSLKASFAEWVQVDPLRIADADIRTLAVQPYSITEEKIAGPGGFPTTRMSVKPEREIRLKKDKDAQDWAVEEPLPGETLKADAASALMRAASGLKLTGVQPFSREKLQARGIAPAAPQARAQLKNSGTLLVRDGQGEFTLLANEGELRIGTKDGLVYYLLFGEISATEDAEKAKEDEDKTSSDRFMAVFVDYRPERDENLPEAIMPETPPTPTPTVEGAVDALLEAQVPTNAAEIKKAQDAGLAKAQKEQTRFQRFFYVISDDDFKSLRPAATDLFEQANVNFPTK